MAGYILLAATVVAAASLVTWNIADPSLTHATSGPTRNLLGPVGAIFSDLLMQLLGLAGVFVTLPPLFWGLEMIGNRRLDRARFKLVLAPISVVLLACAASALPKIGGWPMPYGLGGALGDVVLRGVTSLLAMIRPERASAAAGLFCFAGGIMLFAASLGLTQKDLKLIFKAPRGLGLSLFKRAWRRLGEMSEHRAASARREPVLDAPPRQRFAMPPHVSVPVPAFDPVPHAYRAPEPPRRPALDPAFDVAEVDEEAHDMDPELERIVGICAPKSAVRPARVPHDPIVPPPAPPVRFPPARDPIADARRVKSAAEASFWPGSVAPPRQHSSPEQHRPADHGVDHGQPSAQVPLLAPEDWRTHRVSGGDPLYRPAVALVLNDRKASARYLEQMLKIGYMRAADLIEQMERDGFVGAPVYNGIRPILIGGPGPDQV